MECYAAYRLTVNQKGFLFIESKRRGVSFWHDMHNTFPPISHSSWLTACSWRDALGVHENATFRAAAANDVMQANDLLGRANLAAFSQGIEGFLDFFGGCEVFG